MINKKKINFSLYSTFQTKKLSADINNTSYTVGYGGEVLSGEPDILWQSICFIKDTQNIWTGGLLYECVPNPTKLSELTNDTKFVTIEDTDKKYMPKGSTSSSGSSLSVSLNGSFNNYGNNGLAFNAVRDFSLEPNNTKWNSALGSGFKIDAASFGVKDNGTTAFSHKKYDTFNKETGAYTGAKNTAVLVFSGRTGFMYAKNTGTASDVTDAMYKYVGVIDSPDANQKVYSASQSDGITNALALRITDLEGLNEYLMSVINLLIEKTGVTAEELEAATNGIIAQQSLSNIEDDVQTEIANNTLDYSDRSNEESLDEV